MSQQVAGHKLSVREKLLTQGAESLSDAELLTAFISSGTSNRSCIQLAQDLLKQVGDLRAILNASFQSFKQVSGLGLVRYVQLQAAQEICRRSDFIHLQKKPRLFNTQQTYAFLKRRLRDKKNEVVAALFLDTQHHVITYEELFIGTINMATIHSRPIVTRVLQLNAAAIILAHNHPSGVSKASKQDISVTERIRQAIELVDARLLDHLVVGDNEVYSILHGVTWRCH